MLRFHPFFVLFGKTVRPYAVAVTSMPTRWACSASLCRARMREKGEFGLNVWVATVRPVESTRANVRLVIFGRPARSRIGRSAKVASIKRLHGPSRFLTTSYDVLAHLVNAFRGFSRVVTTCRGILGCGFAGGPAVVGERLLTVQEVADRARVSTETSRRWLRQRPLRGVRPGGGRAGWRKPEPNRRRLRRIGRP